MNKYCKFNKKNYFYYIDLLQEVYNKQRMLGLNLECLLWDKYYNYVERNFCVFSLICIEQAPWDNQNLLAQEIWTQLFKTNDVVS